MNTNMVLMIVAVVAAGTAVFVGAEYHKAISAQAAAAKSMTFEQRWPSGAWRFQ